jgi:hypothetical protein
MIHDGVSMPGLAAALLKVLTDPSVRSASTTVRVYGSARAGPEVDLILNFVPTLEASKRIDDFEVGA